MLVAAVAGLSVPAVTRAQQVPPPRLRREIRGFDFRKDGVWRRQARAVRALRARLLSRRNFGALNAPMAAAGAPLASGAAVSGVLRVPAILFKFKDTPGAQLRTTTQYTQVLFAASPTGASAGRPYTYRTFYEQMSNGLLSVQGASFGYAALDSNEVTYTGVAGTCNGNPYGNTNCNGLFSPQAVAHETGHGFGLPDLYDTSNQTEGIGEYSLMGSGNYTSPLSPSRLDAWSLNELGWVTIFPIATDNTYTFGPAPISDTAFYLPVGGANPRGEYFLLENRQRVQSDSAMLRDHCQAWYASPTPPTSCGGGLLIWHVDSAQIASALPANQVDSGPIHGLAIVQADGYQNLDNDPGVRCFPSAPTPTCSDRGDAGDLYPGPTGNVAFNPTSTPAAVRNADGLPAGLVLDQITQLPASTTMQFRLSYPVWVVRATDSAAVIQFDGLTYHLFRDILTQGSVHSVSVADTQFTAGGRTRHLFVSWSGGQPRSFSYLAGATPETLTVTLARSQQVHYTATSGGTISGSVPSDTFVAEGTPVTLTATDTSVVRAFQGWAGDTVTKNLGITLPLGRPYSVRAVFLETFSTAQVVAQLLDGSSTLTPAQLGDLDKLGNNSGGFDLGDFLAWVRATGAPLTTEQRTLLSALRRKGASR